MPAVWFDDMEVRRIEVVAEYDETDVAALTVSVVATGVAAQTRITFDPKAGSSSGHFSRWRMVQVASITSLSYKGAKVLPAKVGQQLRATFPGLPAPIQIPADREDHRLSLDDAQFAAIFRDLRDAWIENGSSENASEVEPQ